MQYAICEINGKQYKVEPNKPLEVDLFGDGEKEIQAKVLLISKDNKVEVGTPYLKDELTLEVIENIKKEKIRVAKFHAKANYRRVKGFRKQVSRVMYSVKS